MTRSDITWTKSVCEKVLWHRATEENLALRCVVCLLLQLLRLQSSLEEAQLQEKQLKHQLQVQSESLSSKAEELRALSERAHTSMTSEMMEVEVRMAELEDLKVSWSHSEGEGRPQPPGLLLLPGLLLSEAPLAAPLHSATEELLLFSLLQQLCVSTGQSQRLCFHHTKPEHGHSKSCTAEPSNTARRFRRSSGGFPHACIESNAAKESWKHFVHMDAAADVTYGCHVTRCLMIGRITSHQRGK